MEIVSHIIQILKKNEQVTIPGLGSFYTEYKPSEIHPVSNTFSPPKNIILFDNFAPDDDFLINWVSEKENITTEDSKTLIINFADNILNELQTKRKSRLEGFGEFFIQSDKTVGFQSDISDITDDSFGLASFSSSLNVNNEFKEKAAKEIQKAREFELNRKFKKKTKAIIVSSIVIISLVLFISFFTDFFRVIFYNNEVKMERPKPTINNHINIIETPKTDNKILKDTIEKSKNETINEKTSKENNPEVTVNNQIAKIENGKKTNAEKENTKLSLKYYIIAGSFKIEENANNRVSELKLKGYKNAGILENKQKNLFMVYYDCFNSQDEVVKAHQNITKIENPESWILKK